MKDRRILTDHWAKPIPLNNFDWSAVFEDYDGAPDAGFNPVGYGATEAEAIADLKAQADEAGIGPVDPLCVWELEKEI